MFSEERKEHLESFQKNLGYTFNNLQLLNKALTHKSYVNETAEPVKSNERFEFMGDSVLDMIVSDFMVRKFPDFAEGPLSKIRAAVVNEACLADLARSVDLGPYLLLGKGEELSGGRGKSSLLADAYEAVAGAVYFDSDMETAFRIFLPGLENKIIQCTETSNYRDFKSELQEYTQTHLNCIPNYRIINETGPDHAKQFEVAAWIQDEMRGEGTGRTKKEAEQAAAKSALDHFKIEP